MSEPQGVLGGWGRRGAVRLAAVAIVAFTAVACGSDKKAAEPTTTTRFPPPVSVFKQEIAEGEGACALLTRAEVEAAVGLGVNPGRGVANRDETGSCSWNVRTNVNQLVAVLVNSGAVTYDNAIAKTPDPEQLAGVGDRAFVAGNTAYALKGNKLVIVQVLTNQPPAVRKQTAIKLVTTAVARG